MEKEKRKYKKILVLSILSVFICSAILYVIYIKDDVYSASVAVSCTGKDYEVKAEGAYLTLELEWNDRKIIKTLAVSENVKEKLSQKNMNDMIGIQMIMNVPKKEMKAYHLDTEDPNIIWFLLEEGMFDHYCEIADVSFHDNDM